MILKPRKFCPNPVAKYGIHKDADSRANPKVIGTPAHEEYWSEQVHRCVSGYTTEGVYIPGFLYYYYNFNTMATVSGMISPDIVDLHIELARLFEFALKNKRNILCAKKRRAGISEFTQKFIDHQWRFTNGAFQGGIAAGQEDYAQDFMRKWRAGESLLPPEFRIKKLKDNKDEVIAGYKYKNDQGELVDEGTKNTLYVRTMFKNPALFKGLFLSVAVAEECGEFEHLKKFYQHTRPCVMDGSVQKGIMIFYGTGGNMNKGGRDFADLWDQAESYNFEKFLIPATRFHKPFYGGCTLEEPKIPNLLKEYSPYQLIGVEDIKAAEEAILKERAELLAAKDVERYQEHLRDYPMTKEDIFSLSVDNDFSSEILNDQRNRISSEPTKYARVRLEWKKTDKGEIVFPRQVELHYENDLTKDCILIHHDHLVPKKDYANLYVAGVDSYHQKQAKTSKSKGAMCVLIRNNMIPGALQMAPVATVCCRPERKEIFFDMCLMLALFFDLKQSVLIDQANPQIFDWFEHNGMAQYLAFRPKKFESEKSQQTGVWGVHLNNYSKPLMVSLMQSAILDYGKEIWFPELIQQLANYNQVTIGTDNDLADAYGIALMQNVSEEVPARENTWYTDKNIYQTPTWYTDANGNKVMKTENTIKILSDEQDAPGQFGYNR